MNIAVCIDDNGGMLFNSRRQSRDRILIEDFLRTAGNNKVFVRSFSEKLFVDINVSVNDNCLSDAEENDFCFIEDESILPFSEKIKTLIIYKWNRVYPADFSFEMPEGFKLSEAYEFQGSSHEKITKEIYVNEN
ncbi:MAG: ribonuclease Z [Clostridia bacterium]|nr:ribonuclease Z [Clostridia bacterium]